MKLNQLIVTLLAIAACAATWHVAAAGAASPTARILSATNDGYVRKISDNGKWGVIEGSGTTEGSITPGGAFIINLETLAKTDISHSSGLCGVSDITDDGTIAVGEAVMKPAYYSTATKKWTTLALPRGAVGGRLESVTPDGRYAAGYYEAQPTAADQDFNDYLPLMYDLTTGARIDLPNMPVLDMQHENKHMNFVSDMSADGRYLVGRVSQSYIQPPGIFSYVYDRETATYTPIGFTESQTTSWTPAVEGTHFCDFPFMSPDGNYVVGTAYMVKASAGSEWPNEYKAVYRYHISTGEYICYDANASEQNIDGVSVLNDGTVTAATPTDNPYADALVRTGKYFVSLDQILRQTCGLNLNDKTGWDNTGKLIAVSADGKTLITLTSPQTSFIIHLPESLSDLAAKVDLLAGYTITPESVAVMSKLKTFKVKFDRNIAVAKAANKITFKATDGSVSYTALKAEVPADATTTLSVTFQTRQLKSGVEYELSIPEGMITVAGDASIASKAMTFKYTGHDDTPIRPVSIYPSDGSDVAYLDLANNPVSIRFDMNLAFGTTPMASLYRQGEDTPYANRNMAVGDNLLLVYPTSRVNLYQGTDYELVINAGTLTDITGGCPNDEIRLQWHGSYVREVSADDIYLFRDECDNYENFMFYDGDGNTPASIPAGWGFTSEIPWYIVRSSAEVTDMAYGSHSMYSPAGKSDDWFMTPQLFIPDENCYLSFDAQSYKFGKSDVLKVYVYENENVYNTLTADIVAAVRANGTVVFNEVLSPGATEEGLEDDWTKYIVRLDAFAGKEIYIAFVNDNEDQSAIFMDNIEVVHDMHFLVTVESPTRVVNKDDIAIYGNVTVASEIDVFDNIEIILADAGGYTVATIKESNLGMSKGSVYNFAFDTPLPLVAGEVNKYTLSVKLGDISTIINGEVRNMLFEPYKRIIVEEYSGRDCGNCPLGFLAMDNLKALFPGRVLPIVIRTYQSDPLGNTVTGYSQYLGMEVVGAPSGRINRSAILSPAMSTADGYTFSGALYDDELWFDRFQSELEEPAEAAIKFTTTFSETTKTATVNTVVRNALNVSGANINIFAVLVENGVDAVYQSNYYANVESDALGAWGKGGSYATAYVAPFTIDEVARATWGNTYQGTGGLIPADIEAGKEYRNVLEIPVPASLAGAKDFKPMNYDVVVMLIDAIKGTVLNANRAPMVNGETPDDLSGVENVIIAGSDSATDIRIAAAGGNIVATGATAVRAYTPTGKLIGAATATDGEVAVIALNGYTGIVLVSATDAAGRAASAKIVVK